MILQSDEERLYDLAASCRNDPYRFVLMAYPWGESGGPLEKFPEGPDDWQVDVLKHIRDNLSREKPLRIAIAGGVGPGKSTVMAWVNDWALTTCVDTRCRVTANTGPQLTTTTWPELLKWRRMSLWSHWFVAQERRIRSADEKFKESWRCDALTWDAQRPEAFAGFHNKGKRIILGFDEASSIDEVIWAYSENILSDSDTEIIWLCLGNPTRSTGRFRECFPGGRYAGLWWTKAIDTRTARMTNKAQIKEWIDYYGIDHDFVRVRVLSLFPRAGSTQFISSEAVELAASADRDPDVGLHDPLVMGVDVARFGDDKSVIRFRRGRDARTIKALKFRGLDTMQLAARVAEQYERYHPDAIFVDEGGVGGGVVDRCRYLRLPVTGVNFGASPDRSQVGQSGNIRYFNKRAEMWGVMKDWLQYGMIENDSELKAELTAVEYGYRNNEGYDALILERKEDMKKRGLSSPDDGDALALTFAYPVAPSDHTAGFFGQGAKHEFEYDPYGGR